MLKMLIAVDGSAHAARAIDEVARMSRAGVPLEVVLLHVRGTPIAYGELPLISSEAVEAAQRTTQDQLLADAEAHARDCGLALRAVQRAVGFPSDEIVRVANEHAVDQIVMGTHGRGAVGSLFLGSVAQRVVHQSTQPVLLVK